MRRIVILGVALAAVFAVVAVDAISVSASGDEFVSSKAGKIKSKGTAQRFKTSAGTIECSEVLGKSEVTSSELKSVTHKEVLTFISCTGFGSTITISAAYLELNANGSAKLEKRVSIKPEGAGLRSADRTADARKLWIQQRFWRQGDGIPRCLEHHLQGHGRRVRWGKHGRVLQRLDRQRTRRWHRRMEIVGRT